MKLIDALSLHPRVSIFAVLNADAEDKSKWDVLPMKESVLAESEDHDFFIVKAKHIQPDGAVADCYIDICLPERISDFVYFLRKKRVEFCYHHECEGDVICAVPIDCFGLYELFYSKIAPDVGIDILKRGLKKSPNKTYIAEDLGYIFRDEERFAEATEMFQIAVDSEPSSYFIYGELADCYEEVGQAAKAKKYRTMFKRADKS